MVTTPWPSEFLQDFQWQGTRDMSSFLTIPKAIDFFLEYIQPNQLHCRKIILEAFSRFKSILGTNAISPGSDWIGQMVSHPLPKDTPSDKRKFFGTNIRLKFLFLNGMEIITYVLHFRFIMKKDLDSLMSVLGSIF